MRLWLAMILALSVMLVPLGVSSSASAMSAPDCAGKAGHACPCKNAPKACAEVCAAIATAAIAADAPSADSEPHAVAVAHVSMTPLTQLGIARGLDPPVPRA